MPPEELAPELDDEEELLLDELELLELDEDDELELLEDEELEEELEDEELELDDEPESWTTALLLVTEPAVFETTTV